MLPTLRADQHRPRTRGRAAEQIQHRGSRASGDRAPAARPPFVPQTAGFKGQNAWPTASRMANASETPLPPTPPPLSVSRGTPLSLFPSREQVAWLCSREI